MCCVTRSACDMMYLLWLTFPTCNNMGTSFRTNARSFTSLLAHRPRNNSCSRANLMLEKGGIRFQLITIFILSLALEIQRGRKVANNKFGRGITSARMNWEHNLMILMSIFSRVNPLAFLCEGDRLIFIFIFSWSTMRTKLIRISYCTISQAHQDLFMRLLCSELYGYAISISGPFEGWVVTEFSIDK